MRAYTYKFSEKAYVPVSSQKDKIEFLKLLYKIEKLQTK